MDEPFNWKNPDYDAVFLQRIARLKRLRDDPGLMPPLKKYYADHWGDFINDWGVTVDPRNIERGLPARIPFALFPKQFDWVQWVHDHWRRGLPGLTDKSRDSGVTWLAVAVGCAACLHLDGMAIGFGSRKEEYVDKMGDPKSIFYKARMFMDELPVEFRGGWDINRHARHLRLDFPETGSTMTGEAGNNIGRGDRASIYFVDEAAFLEQPLLVEASLSQTTNCRMDISTPNGLGNPFEQKRHGGKVDVFTFHWTEDPRKDDAWYRKQIDTIDNPTIVAQEIDIDYSASVEGVLIPAAWARAALDAHLKIGINVSGERVGALDVADEGKDANAFCGGRGILIERIEEWSGVGSDIYATVERAFGLCDELGHHDLKYDADGLGAGVRGDARKINEERARKSKAPVRVLSFRGSEGVVDPKGQDEPGRLNEDFFANRKAQGWWALRKRFKATHRAIKELAEHGAILTPIVHDDLISISSKAGNTSKLINELSQPTYSVNAVGKLVVDKMPEGAKSPNNADATMIRFARIGRVPIVVTDDAIAIAEGRA